MNRVGSGGVTLGDFLPGNIVEQEKGANKRNRLLALPVTKKMVSESGIPASMDKSPLKTKPISIVKPSQVFLSKVEKPHTPGVSQFYDSMDKVEDVVKSGIREQQLHESSKLDLKLKKYWWLPNIENKSLEHKKCLLEILEERETLAKEILREHKGQSIEDIFGKDVYIIPSIGDKGYLRVFGLTGGDLLRWNLGEVFLVFSEISEKDKPIWYTQDYPIVRPVEYPFLPNVRKFMELHKALSGGHETPKEKILPLLALF